MEAPLAVTGILQANGVVNKNGRVYEYERSQCMTCSWSMPTHWAPYGLELYGERCPGCVDKMVERLEYERRQGRAF